MTHRARVADFWDDHLAQWEPDQEPTSEPLASWFASYRGSGAGAIDLSCYPDPYVGDLRGISGEPKLVFLGLNPGVGYLPLQGSTGTWTQRIRDESYSRCLTRSPVGDLDLWIEHHGGESVYWRNLTAFTRRWTKDPSAGGTDILGFELYPWHSGKINGPMRPPADVITSYVWEPIQEIDVPVVFAFGSPWFRALDDMGYRPTALFGAGGHPFPRSVNENAKWRVGIFTLPSGQLLVASAQLGYAGPPGADGTEILRETLEPFLVGSATAEPTKDDSGAGDLIAHDLDELISISGYGDPDDLAWALFNEVDWPDDFPDGTPTIFEDDITLFGIEFQDAPDLGGLVAREIPFPTTVEAVFASFEQFASGLIEDYSPDSDGGADLVRVPSASDGTWGEFYEFGLSYDGYRRIAAEPDLLYAIAYVPAHAAYRDGRTDRIGIDLLRAVLFYLSRADRMAGEIDFGSPEEEQFWRWVMERVEEISGGSVPRLSDY